MYFDLTLHPLLLFFCFYIYVYILLGDLSWPSILLVFRFLRKILVNVLHPFASEFKLQLQSLFCVDEFYFVGAWVALASCRHLLLQK